MPSAYADQGRLGPSLLTTFLAHQKPGVPTLPVRVGNQDTQALLDTGSVVTLLRPDLAGGWCGEPIKVACARGHTHVRNLQRGSADPPWDVHGTGRDRTTSPRAPINWERLPHILQTLVPRTVLPTPAGPATTTRTYRQTRLRG